MTETSARNDAAALPVALCLSGGGYRAMLFHAGALLRMSETGWLQRLDLVSSVSGGSIIAGQLASQWAMLVSSPDLPQAYRDRVITPLLKLAGKRIDKRSVIRGFVSRGGSAGRVSAAYRKHIYGRQTLQQLPDHPRFVINATNLQSGALWRFSKPYARDYKVGGIEHPDFELATAVAASSAFPPFLSPLVLDLSATEWTWPGDDPTMQQGPYRAHVVLGDGGIYDNLALESAKRSTTILVSDGGGQMANVPAPRENWVGQLRRVLEVEDNQVRSLRKRRLIDSYDSGVIAGTYWGIRSDIERYGLADSLPCPHTATMRLAAIRTRLAPIPKSDRLRLVNWGYAVCDAALRRYVDQSLQPPSGFPFPRAAILSHARLE
ncbi:patatin-like phospholipase family protein [Streptomyces sp. NPDC059496]|uniref:patatin-like phospholipase family protein n=1 Tax=Streptomyces sp. NPDC059496 TaxID=3346851 RepID=UPI0036871B1A